MEQNLDNMDEEKARLKRAERMRRMRLEKQRQEERRRMLQKRMPLIAGSLVVFVLIIVGVVALIRKPEENAAQTKTHAEQAPTPDGATPIGATQTGATPSGAAQSEAELRENADGNTVGSVARDLISKEVEENTIIYRFEQAEDAVTIQSEEVISTNAILVDESTNQIVASKGAYDRISPASMTKVLTVLVAAENISEEDLNDTFTMTSAITDYAYVNDCSVVGFLKDEEVTVKDLFYGTVLPSGADAAVGLATYVAGSEEAFVDLMNEKLEALGLSESAHFTNCVGLYDDNHYCTVYDMAVIMKAAMQNELCREVLSKHTYTTVPTAQHPEGIEISNWFLRKIEDKDVGGEVLCAKTGYVVQSQNCAVSYGTFADGVPYICVTAGSTSSWRCIYDHVEIYNRYVLSAN